MSQEVRIVNSEATRCHEDEQASRLVVTGIKSDMITGSSDEHGHDFICIDTHHT